MNTIGSKRLLFIVIFLSTAIAGCTFKFGSMPATEKISSSLTQYVSTKDDVLKVLGPPRGYGRYQTSMIPEVYVLWYYEYTEASTISKNIDLKMLVVLFDKEKYAGHMWFSSFEKFENNHRK